MDDFNKAFIDVLEKIKKALEDGDYSKAKDYSSDLISASYIMRNKYALFISEFLYAAFDDLEVADRLIEVIEFLRRRRVQTRLPMRIRSLEPTEDEIEDIKKLVKIYESLMNSIKKFLLNVHDTDTRSALLEDLANFRFKINELTEKYG